MVKTETYNEGNGVCDPVTNVFGLAYSSCMFAISQGASVHSTARGVYEKPLLFYHRRLNMTKFFFKIISQIIRHSMEDQNKLGMQLITSLIFFVFV